MIAARSKGTGHDIYPLTASQRDLAKLPVDHTVMSDRTDVFDFDVDQLFGGGKGPGGRHFIGGLGLGPLAVEGHHGLAALDGYVIERMVEQTLERRSAFQCLVWV